MEEQTISRIAAVVLSLSVMGCGHYPAQLGSDGDIFWTSSGEYMVNIDGLPLKDWPKLEKFQNLEHLYANQRIAPQVTDAHLKVLGAISLPKLRDLNVNDCRNVTDEGICALTNLPSIAALGLGRTRISDNGLFTIATSVPRLAALNLQGCDLLTFAGLQSLTNASELAELSLSSDCLTQTELEKLIVLLKQVTWWGIDDGSRKLSLEPLLKIAEEKRLTVVLNDGDAGRGISDVIRSGYKTQPRK